MALKSFAASQQLRGPCVGVSSSWVPIKPQLRQNPALHTSSTRAPTIDAATCRQRPNPNVSPNAIQSPSAPSSDGKKSSSQSSLMNYQMVDLEGDFPECSPSLVKVDNKAHELYTCLSVDVADYPGLLRTITWCLNGMCMRVQNATLQTQQGYAHDVFYLTTWAGKKPSDEQAAMLAERIQDFVVFCEPRKCTPNEWAFKNLFVSNADHPDWTVLTIEGEPKRHGFLLELATVLSGTGAHIQEAYIQSGPPEGATNPGGSGPDHQPVNVAPAGYDFTQGRYFKFLLSDTNGAKLDPSRVGAILFTYDVFTDARHMPLVAPSMDTYLRQQTESGCE